MNRVRTSYGYDTYRGRSKTRTVLTAIIVILLVVLVLAVAAFFFLQQFMVYTDDGQWHLELPFLDSQKEDPSTLPPLESQTLIIVTPPPTPTPTAAPSEPPMTAVWLLRSAITDGTAERLVKSVGGTAAVFNMKSDAGQLGYVSDLDQAIAMGSSAAEPGLNDAIQALNASNLYTVARISCFKDNRAPRMDNGLAIRTTSGYNWTDDEGIRWMSPASEEARAYLVGICKELAGLGFDEILLENASYPAQGSLQNIKVGESYDPEDLLDPVDRFYTEVSETLRGTGVRLSIATQPAVLDGTGDQSGQTPALLETYAERVYVTIPETPDSYAAAREAGLEESQLVYAIATNRAAEELGGEASTLIMFSEGIKK